MALRPFQTAVLAAVCALGAAAGCATTSKSEAGGKRYTVVCNEKPTTGSNIGRLKCYRRIDAEFREQRDRAGMEKVQYNTSRAQKAQ